VAQPNELAVFEGDRVQWAETLRLPTVKETHHILLPEEVRDADHYLGTSDPSYISACTLTKWRSTLTRPSPLPSVLIQP